MNSEHGPNSLIFLHLSSFLILAVLAIALDLRCAIALDNLAVSL
jgi:hypothetical protein